MLVPRVGAWVEVKVASVRSASRPRWLAGLVTRLNAKRFVVDLFEAKEVQVPLHPSGPPAAPGAARWRWRYSLPRVEDSNISVLFTMRAGTGSSKRAARAQWFDGRVLRTHPRQRTFTVLFDDGDTVTLGADVAWTRRSRVGGAFQAKVSVRPAPAPVPPGKHALLRSRTQRAGGGDRAEPQNWTQDHFGKWRLNGTVVAWPDIDDR